MPVITARYALSRASILQTLLLIQDYREYKRSQGWDDTCFTYRGLRYHLFYRYHNKRVEWHTVERTLRRLAEEGLLRRKELKRKKRVIFCVTRDLEVLISQVQELRQQAIEGAKGA